MKRKLRKKKKKFSPPVSPNLKKRPLPYPPKKEQKKKEEKNVKYKNKKYKKQTKNNQEERIFLNLQLARWIPEHQTTPWLRSTLATCIPTSRRPCCLRNSRRPDPYWASEFAVMPSPGDHSVMLMSTSNNRLMVSKFYLFNFFLFYLYFR